MTTGLRELKKAQTRAALSRAGAELFARYGFDAVTVEDVCAAVNLSPRTFFRYFSTKADLVVAAIEEILLGLLVELRARPDGEAPWTSLRHAVLAAADQIGRRRAEFVALSTVTRAAPELIGGNAGAFIQWERELSAEVARRLDPAAGDRARLLTGIALTAFRVGLDAWIDAGAHADPAALVGDNLDQLRVAAQRMQRG